MTHVTPIVLASIIGLLLVTMAFLTLLAFKLRKAIREVFRALARVERATAIDRKQRDAVRRVNQDLDTKIWSQLESLTTLYRLIDGKPTLGPTRGWSLSPDILLHIVRYIEDQRPEVIVECGAGASTIVIATALQALGQSGRLISLEDHPYFVSETSHLLKHHGLDQYASVVSSPLTPRHYDGFGDIFHWYGLDRRRLPDAVDLLVVDGPWGKVNRLARYPAGPELFPLLSPNARIFLDDTNREDESRLPKLWQKIHDALEARNLDVEKGGIELAYGGFGNSRPPNIILEQLSH